MNKKISKAFASSIMAAAMFTSTTAAYAPFNASAELLAENTFDSKMLPWHTVESAPAEQYFAIEDGAVHITINESEGLDGEKWDLQFRYRNLSFQKGHTYKIRFDAKAKRNGMQLCSQIATISGDEEYVVLNGEGFEEGPHMGGQWGKAATLTTEYQTFEGEFTCTKDLEDVEWGFHYAKGTQYDGNAVDGDEIWFDNMSIICTSCDELYGCNQYDNPEFATPTTTTATTTTKPKTTTTKPKTTTTKPKSTTTTSTATKPKTTTTPTTTITPPAATNEVQVLGETSFDYKLLPWHFVSSSPAKQQYAIEDGAAHVTILIPVGADHEKWDLQFKHKDLSFKKGHTYEVSFKAKASRSGIELCSKIGDYKGEEEYFVGNGDEFQMGPHMDGQWGKAFILTTSYQTFEGTFTPTKDIENVEWVFQYADGTQYEGNTQDGDEIWFDDMSIICTTCPEDTTTCEYDKTIMLYTDRDSAAKLNPDQLMVDGEMVNFISVNQLGYLPNLAKVATFGDNAGSITPNSSEIELTEDCYDFELVDVKTGKVVYEGVSGKKFKDADSADNVCKLDFSEFKTPGEYYLRIAATNWRSFNFRIADDIYRMADRNMLTDAVNVYYQNRSGIDVTSDYITSGDKQMLAHADPNNADFAYVQKIWKNTYSTDTEITSTYGSSEIDVSGGWYACGEHAKYVVSGGMTAWTLQNMYERSLLNEKADKFDDGSGLVVVPENKNDVPDILDEVAYELDWMSKMKVQADEPTWGEYAGLYYHKVQDYKWYDLNTMPQYYKYSCENLRVVKPPTFAATLNYAACAAQAARLWAPYDAEKAANYLNSAVEAYEAYQKHYYEYDDTHKIHPEYQMSTTAEELREDSLYAPSMQAKGGAAYGDNNVTDEAYWAACEIFVSASRMDAGKLANKYLSELAEYENAFKIPTEIIDPYPGMLNEEVNSSLNWRDTGAAGTLTLALNSDLLPDYAAKDVNDAIVAAADKYIEIQQNQGYGIPYEITDKGYNDPIGLTPHIELKGYRKGSNAIALNNALIMAYAYDITDKAGYINGAAQTLDYLLGTNPMSFSYVTGYGSYYAKNPTHRFWIGSVEKSYPYAPDGVLVGGSSGELTDDYVRHLGFDPGAYDNPAQSCYADSIEAYSVNSTNLEWNAPFAWVLSFINDESADVVNTGDVEVKATLYGDANNDGVVSIADASAILQALGNSDKYKLSDEGAANADVIDNGGGLSVADALAIQAVDAKLVDVKLFPMTQESYDAVLKYDAVIKGE
ncbi:MAG: glycoside hydrolase family 9 protein [Ruminococcus sp.]|nr:glycoside hydrolase family 9 protein [Ruminococcus sp.]